MADEPKKILSSKHFTYKFYTRASFGPDHTPYYTSWSDQILHQFDAQEKQRFYSDRKAIHDLWDRLGAATKTQDHASEHVEAMKLWVQNMRSVKRKVEGPLREHHKLEVQASLMP
ncbi:MAG: hypothetical protein L6R42_009529 [Xanthoria sp. 1 TBL-2021]|nr:MAG: hypothetical protein L6R42_009529 [Xanthoria sp. 1 TBL-2021]